MSSVGKLFMAVGSAIVMGEHPSLPSEYQKIACVSGGDDPVFKLCRSVFWPFRKIGGGWNLMCMFWFRTDPNLRYRVDLPSHLKDCKCTLFKKEKNESC